MIIRPSLASDAAAIEGMFREFAADLRSIGDDTPYDFGAARYLADGFGSAPAFRGLIAEDASGPIGYLLFCPTYEGDYVRAFYLVDVYVRGRARSRGVGRQLMAAVRDIAAAEGMARLSWSVHASNARARRFYERLGASYVSDVHQMYLAVTPPPAPAE